MIDADSHQRVDVLPDRKSDTLAGWLREHPGVEIVVRDGSTTYAEAVRRAVPCARQVSDRWHLWHSLTRVAEKLVAAHSTCWAKAGPKRQALTREHTSLRGRDRGDQRSQAVQRQVRVLLPTANPSTSTDVVPAGQTITLGTPATRLSCALRPSKG